MAVQRKVAITALYMIFFIDLISLVIVIIILGPLMLQQDSPLALPGFSTQQRLVLAGAMYAAYPATQLLSNPILGGLSDWFGERRILLYSTFGSGLSLILSAIAVSIGSISLFFISRLFAGLTSGNITVTQSGVASLTTYKVRGRHMAIFATLRGLGWVLGPLFVIFLSDKQMVGLFDLSTPFWVLAALFFIAFVLVFASVEDTHTQPLEGKRHSHIRHAVAQLVGVFHLPSVVTPFLVGSFNRAGWTFWVLFLSPYLVAEFNLDQHHVSEVYLYSSIWYLASGLFCQGWLYRKVHTNLLLVIFLFVQAVAIGALVPFSNPAILWWVIPIVAASQTIVMTGFFMLYSGLAGPKNQGLIFGAWNASLAASGASVPIIEGWVAGYWLKTPFIIASVILFGTALYFLIWYICHHKGFLEARQKE